MSRCIDVLKKPDDEGKYPAVFQPKEKSNNTTILIIIGVGIAVIAVLVVVGLAVWAGINYLMRIDSIDKGIIEDYNRPLPKTPPKKQLPPLPKIPPKKQLPPLPETPPKKKLPPLPRMALESQLENDEEQLKRQPRRKTPTLADLTPAELKKKAPTPSVSITPSSITVTNVSDDEDEGEFNDAPGEPQGKIDFDLQ